MFKKTRRKIVASIMSVLVLLRVGTLGIIYASSYIEMTERNEKMLAAHAGVFTLSSPPDKMRPDYPGPGNDKEKFEPDFSLEPMLRLSTFYTVALSDNGEILEIRNGQPNLHSDDELKSLAENIIRNGKHKGTKDNLSYYKADKPGYCLVVFMDNTVINENAATLFRYTLIFGAAALITFFFLSVILAKKIVNPLEESHQKQKQFISDAGHELKTPVSVVSANAELLTREIGENQWLQNIMYENERMGVLIGQLLELARNESVAAPTEELDLSRLVKGEALPFESVAYEKGLELICNTDNDIVIRGNGTRLRQLVSILLDNAIRHNKGGNDITLTLTREHGLIRLSVTNTGDDIPKEQRRQIFERFYRADPARNADDNHYGLGLAIAKAIVDSHKGRIDVICYNNLVEFRVMLPVRH